jgi:hypothetical protein
MGLRIGKSQCSISILKLEMKLRGARNSLLMPAIQDGMGKDKTRGQFEDAHRAC